MSLVEKKLDISAAVEYLFSSDDTKRSKYEQQVLTAKAGGFN